MGVTKVTSLKGRQPFVLACALASEPVGLKPGSANSKGHWQTKVSFAVGVTDNGEPGTNDFFSIQLSNGYSASRYPLNGDISIHLQHIWLF
jgi:hypothetical protein